MDTKNNENNIAVIHSKELAGTLLGSVSPSFGVVIVCNEGETDKHHIYFLRELMAVKVQQSAKWPPVNRPLKGGLRSSEFVGLQTSTSVDTILKTLLSIIAESTTDQSTTNARKAVA